MNKNKIILLAIAAVVGVCIFILILLLQGNEAERAQAKNLNIWTVGHKDILFGELISEFKEDVSSVSVSFTHRNFDSFNDYQNTLLYELANGNGPDIFMLNNSESLFLENSIFGIDPAYLSASDFRQKLLPLFGEQLIREAANPDDPSEIVEYVLGVPAGFQTLGLFYDRRSFIGKDVTSWAGIATASQELKEKNRKIVPIGIGHGSTVYDVENIFTQFLVNTGSKGILDLDRATMRRALGNYFLYSDGTGNNGYETIIGTLEEDNKNNISAFSNGEIKMLIGYPSVIEEIKESGFSQSFLSAAPFPKSLGENDRISIDYNYFVINKTTQNIKEASVFLSYLVSDEGADDYYDIFTSRIPADETILNSKLESKIDEKFNVVYQNFLRNGAVLVSYDRGIKGVFDDTIKNILDNENSATDKLEDMQSLMKCRIEKLGTSSSQNARCN